MDSAAPQFCIQLQPDRLPEAGVGADFIALIRQACAVLALDKKLIRRFGVVDGAEQPDETGKIDNDADAGAETASPYLNLMFETDRPTALWAQLQKKLYQDERLGPPLRQASMTICTGEEGWDDYLLLYHYDPAIECDTLPPDM